MHTLKFKALDVLKRRSDDCMIGDFRLKKRHITTIATLFKFANYRKSLCNQVLWRSNADLAKSLNCSIPTVRRIFKDLERNGLIEIRAAQTSKGMLCNHVKATHSLFLLVQKLIIDERLAAADSSNSSELYMLRGKVFQALEQARKIAAKTPTDPVRALWIRNGRLAQARRGKNPSAANKK